MTARRLRPLAERIEPIQCQAGIDDTATSPLPRNQQRSVKTRTRIYDFDPYCCQKSATVELDGHLLCNLHAGRVALAQVLGEPNPIKYGPGKPRTK